MDGLIERDNLNGNLKCDAGETPGSYNINQETLENLNYTIMFSTGTFTITAKSVPEEPENPSEELTNEHPEWGILEIHEGITHYVDAQGMTSVEISPENTDENGIVWVKEESHELYLGYDTAAWYGFDDSDGVFENGSRAYVQVLYSFTILNL